ncbi:exported hypothetical protein [Sphingobacterium sp. PM2-P1-29]|jgi:hypothetical protein|nr:exported hypothetical protein [Sphingobacterium sp. PM2-P1-29]
MKNYLLLLLLLPFLLKSQTLPQIFVHTDRGAYFPGDTVWFKAYVMNEGLLDAESHNLYLNMGNGDGVIRQRSILLLKNGMAAGYLVVPRQGRANNLFLNAYTKAMAVRPELYYIKTIPLIPESTTAPSSASALFQDNEIQLETYPVGGSFIAGVENELLIKSYLKGGKGISTSGRITDSAGSLSMPFHTDSTGYTRIKINPEPNTAYQVFWRRADGRDETGSVMDINYVSSKVMMQDMGSDSIRITVQSNMAANYELEARINYRQLFNSPVDFSASGQKNIYLKKSDLEQGILQVFLRHNTGKLLGRSAHMLGPPSEVFLTPEVVFNQNSMEEKGRNSFSIALSGETAAYLSIAITDIQMPVDTIDNIVGDIYLKPYLQNKNNDLKQYLAHQDKLQDILQNHLKPINFGELDRLPVVKDSLLYLKGKILMRKNEWTRFYARYQKLMSHDKKSKVGQRGASFGYKKQGDKQMVYTEVVPDSSGWFSIPELTFYDSLETRFSQIYRDLKFDEYKISYHFSDVTPSERLYIPAKAEQGIHSGVINNHRYYYGADYYIDNKGMRHIREVPVYRSKQQKRLDALEEKYTSHAFKGKAKFVFDPHSEEQIIKRSMSLQQYLQEKIRRPTYGSIFLNERLISESNEVNLLLESDMSQIIYVKYYDYFRFHDFGGQATLVYQLTPSEIDSDFGKRIDEQIVSGYLGGGKFQNKVYNQTLARLVSDYDYRPTLYWNPDVQLQQKEKPVIFYNNSRAKGYWITIQGVTQSGKLVFYQKRYPN